MAENNAKHVAEEIEEIEGTEEEINPTRRQRFFAWIKNHKVQIGIGAGAAALTGVGLVVKKAVKDRTGLDLGGEIAEAVGEAMPPEI